MPVVSALSLGFVIASCIPAGRPRLAEILYDPSGADTGHEFVELYNPGNVAYALAGLALEAGDGAAPGRWTARWHGAASDSIAAGGRFVIGGALVNPTPAAIVTLDLQNGPDAVRLIWPDGAEEVVGYGALADAEYFCVAPAADVASGQSLARLPDTADRGANDLDFQGAEPTPGRPNEVRRDVAVRRHSLRCEPAQPSPATPAIAFATLLNGGTDALAAGEVTFDLAADGVTLARVPAEALAPGDSARITLELPGMAEGIHTLACVAELANDDRIGNESDTLRVRVGPGPLTVTEIQFHPANGEGEWIEVRAREGERVPIALASFTLSDRNSRGAPLPPGAPGIMPESLAVLAQNRAALLLRFPRLDSTRVVEVAPWPAMNNSDDSTGFADAVILRESDGLPSDRVDYSAHGIAAGVPLELGEGGWRESSEAMGTPLRPPRPLPAISGHFALAPRRVSADRALTLEWSLPWPRAWLAIEVFDLAGRRVTRVAEQSVGARGERALGPIAAPGCYFVALRARAQSGEGVVRETQTLRVERAR